MKMSVLRETSTEELKEELTAVYRELFSLRMQRASMETTTVKPHSFSLARRKIARIKTIINQRKADK